MDGGGSERQLLYLLKGLDRKVFEPSLYLLRTTGQLLEQIPSDCPVSDFWTGREPTKLNWPGRDYKLQIKHLAQHIRSHGIQVLYDRLFHMTMISGPACLRARCARVSWSNSVKNIIAIGRLGAEKGHSDLIEAFALLVQKRGKQFNLHIAGEGVLRESLEGLIAQRNLSDCAFLHGYVSNPYPLLKQADLMVLPSLYEGLPNVMLEAMLCQCPVLATNTEQGAGEYLRQYPLGDLVPIGSIPLMLERMENCFDQPDKWKARAAVAYHHVLEHHDLDRWIQRVSGILLRAAETKLP